jgi:hypothetical protein
MIMSTPGVSRKLVLSTGALFLLGTTIVGVTRVENSPVTRVPICVKENGQLRMLTGNNAMCEPSERLLEWVVGGEVTDIQLGRGLVGNRNDGTVQLAIDPSIIDECTNRCGGKVFAGFNDGPGQLQYALTADLPTIAELDLPAGDYAIFAKLTVEAEPLFDQFSFQRPVICKLTAGSDFDQATVVLEKIHNESSGEADGSYRLGLNLLVVHSFTAPGSVVLRAAFGGALAVTPQVQFRDLKIIAIQASDISNVFLGGN